VYSRHTTVTRTRKSVIEIPPLSDDALKAYGKWRKTLGNELPRSTSKTGHVLPKRLLVFTTLQRTTSETMARFKVGPIRTSESKSLLTWTIQLLEA